MTFATPSATFPTAVLADADIGYETNRESNVLAVALTAADHSVVLQNDISGLPSVGEITIEGERIFYTAKDDGTKTLTVPSSPEGRGWDGSTAAAHASLNVVYSNHIAWFVNKLAVEMKAVQTAIGPTASQIYFRRDGSLSLTGTILPETDIAVDLGSALKRFRSIYFGPGSLQMHAAAGDANPSFKVSSSGIELGAGGATALDVRLYRPSADVLRTDDKLGVGVTAFSKFHVGGQTNDLVQLVPSDDVGPTTDIFTIYKSNNTDAVFKVSKKGEVVTYGQSIVIAGQPTDTGAFFYLEDANGGAASNSVEFKHTGGDLLWSYSALGGAFSEKMRLALADGQLRLPTTGASAGILIGGDATLYRSAADQLKTDDGMIFEGGYVQITQGGGGQNLLMGNRDSSGTNKPAILRAANADFRIGYGDSWTTTGGTFTQNFLLTSTGVLTFGALEDTNLYRSAANVLATEDRFQAALGLSVGSTGTTFQYTQSYASFPATFTNAAGDFSWMMQVAGTNALGIAAQTGTPRIFLVGNNNYEVAVSYATTVAAVFTQAGQVQFPVTGSTGGLLIGTDWAGYRVSANTLRMGADDSIEGEASSAAVQLFKTFITGDTQYRVAIRGDGQLIFSSGSAAGDTTLYRGAVGQLKTDANFVAGAEVVSYYTNAGQVTLTLVGGAAGILFGSGFDTNLYRGGANQLSTDDNFTCSSDIYSRYGTDPQIRLAASGSIPIILFGSAQDTNLYRSAANVLATDDRLAVVRVNQGDDAFSTEATGVGGFAMFYMTANGTMSWGPGSGAVDTTLYRADVSLLLTEDQFGIIRAATGDRSLYLAVSGDVEGRLIAFADGRLVWGDGTGTGDVHLYRYGANGLGTDDYFTQFPPDATTERMHQFAVFGEANSRIRIGMNNAGVGIIQWGAGGGSAVDTELYRSGGSALKTNSTLTIDTAGAVGLLVGQASGNNYARVQSSGGDISLWAGGTVGILSEQDIVFASKTGPSTTLYARVDVSGDFSIRSGTAFWGKFEHAISADRTWTMPNVTGDILVHDGTDPTETTLTNDTNRTPSTTRPTLVTITIDYNTLAAATERTGTVTVGANALDTQVIIRNFDAVTARRLTESITFVCPKNTAYKINMSSTTNLTLTAVETQL